MLVVGVALRKQSLLLLKAVYLRGVARSGLCGKCAVRNGGLFGAVAKVCQTNDKDHGGDTADHLDVELPARLGFGLRRNRTRLK